MNAQKKTARDSAPAAFKNTHCTSNCGDPIPKAQAWGKISVAVWRTSYMLEESRQQPAALGNFWREAGFCLLLALLKIGRLA